METNQTRNIEMDRENFKAVCNFVRDTESKAKTSENTPEGFDAIMGEFGDKAREMLENMSNDTNLQEKIIELEQAADSVLRFAQENSDVPSSLQDQIKEAHDRVRDVKSKIVH